MTIKKMSSQDYNNILQDATNKIESISQDMKDVKSDMYTKVKIIKHEQDYLSYLYEKATYATAQEDTFIFLNNNKYKGLYEGYSNVAHAYFKQTPINIFNLKVINGKESYFRDEVIVNINGVQDEYFNNILKADDVKGKKIFFEEYEFKSAISTLDDKTPIEEINNKSVIDIKVDKDKVIGISKFNIIEIDPFLYKSFDIDKIEVFTDDSEIPTATIKDIKSIGKTRFILDKKYEFKRVLLHVTHNYNTVADNKIVYPFGIKHLYFLEADFRSDSHITIDYTSDYFIDDIKDRVTVVNATGERMSSVSEEGIKIFLFNNNGMLENEQEPSNDIKKPIARNIKTIYIKIPLKNEAIIGYKFSINKR